MTLCLVFKTFQQANTWASVTSYLERDFPCLEVIRLQTKKMKSGCEKLSLGLLQIEVCLLLNPGEGNGNPLQYSCLENLMDGAAWWATLHGVTNSQTRLSNFTSLHFAI